MATIPSTITYTDIVYKSQPSSSKTNDDFGRLYDNHNALIAATEDIEDDVGSNGDLVAAMASSIASGFDVRYVDDNNITLAYTAIGMTNGTSWTIADTAMAATTLTLADNDGTAGKLDAGTVAADTWYSVWAIMKADSTGAHGCLSLSAAAPAMAGFTGYSGGYYRFRGWIRSNADSEVLPFSYLGAECRFRASNYGDGTETWNKVADGATTVAGWGAYSWEDVVVTCMPSGVDQIQIVAEQNGGTWTIFAREKGSARASVAGTANDYHWGGNNCIGSDVNVGEGSIANVFITLDTSDTFQASVSNTGAAEDIWFTGFRKEY